MYYTLCGYPCQVFFGAILKLIHAARIIGDMTGDELAQRRTELGMTQAELARVLEVRQATISEWETGARRIRLGRVVELALWALQAGQVLALDHDDADDGVYDADS